MDSPTLTPKSDHVLKSPSRSQRSLCRIIVIVLLLLPSCLCCFPNNAEASSVKNGRLSLGIMTVTNVPEYIGKKGGVLVLWLYKGGPAERAGLRKFDIITRFNGQKVDDALSLSSLVESTIYGKDIQLTVLRDKKVLQIQITPTYYSDEELLKEKHAFDEYLRVNHDQFNREVREKRRENLQANRINTEDIISGRQHDTSVIHADNYNADSRDKQFGITPYVRRVINSNNSLTVLTNNIIMLYDHLMPLIKDENDKLQWLDSIKATFGQLNYPPGMSAESMYPYIISKRDELQKAYNERLVDIRAATESTSACHKYIQCVENTTNSSCYKYMSGTMAEAAGKVSSADPEGCLSYCLNKKFHISNDNTYTKNTPFEPTDHMFIWVGQITQKINDDYISIDQYSIVSNFEPIESIYKFAFTDIKKVYGGPFAENDSVIVMGQYHANITLKLNNGSEMLVPELYKCIVWIIK